MRAVDVSAGPPADIHYSISADAGTLYTPTQFQSLTADSSPVAAACGVTLSTRQFRVAVHSGVLDANVMS